MATTASLSVPSAVSPNGAVSPTSPLTPPQTTSQLSPDIIDVPGSRPRAMSSSSALSTGSYSTSPNTGRKYSNNGMALHEMAVHAAQEHLETHGEMSTTEYEAVLNMEGLLQRHQHIHHIIPAALGGMDHIDNYTHSTREHHKMLRSFPDPFDGVALTAWEVGITKITKAVERAQAGGRYKGPTAEALFDRGRELGREQRKAQQRRESFQSEASNN